MWYFCFNYIEKNIKINEEITINLQKSMISITTTNSEII